MSLCESAHVGIADGDTKSSALRLVKGSSAEVSAGACFYTSGKAEEGLLSQDSFLFSEVFTFEFGLTPQFTPLSERPRVFLQEGPDCHPFAYERHQTWTRLVEARG